MQLASSDSSNEMDRETYKHYLLNKKKQPLRGGRRSKGTKFDIVANVLYFFSAAFFLFYFFNQQVF